jgi:hypothetical protein
VENSTIATNLVVRYKKSLEIRKSRPMPNYPQVFETNQADSYFPNPKLSTLAVLMINFDEFNLDESCCMDGGIDGD